MPRRSENSDKGKKDKIEFHGQIVVMEIGGNGSFIFPSRVNVNAPASPQSDVYTEKLFDDHKLF